MSTPTSEIKFFRGDYSAKEKPHTWFRKLEAKFDETTKVETKLYKFAKNLEPGRQAEAWFQSLTAADKATWDTFYMAFTAKWPAPKVAVPEHAELVARLGMITLQEAALGLLVGDEDEKLYSHVAWVEEVRAVVNALNDPQGHLISTARNNLPLAVRLSLPSTTTTWDAFLDAVSTISLDRLRDQMEWMARTQPAGAPQMPPPTPWTNRYASQPPQYPPRQYAAPPSYYTPYAPRAAQPSITVTNPTPTPTTRTGQRETPPHMTPTGWPSLRQPTLSGTPSTPLPQGRYNPNTSPNIMYSGERTLNTTPAYNKGPPQTPSRGQSPSRSPSPSPSPNELARRATAQSSTYPNNDEGAQAYNTAMERWNATYTAARVADFTTAPYPLRPGTANIGNRECFRCGLIGHISTSCPNLADQLDIKEQNWRAHINRCLNPSIAQRNDMFRISQISADDQPVFYDPSLYDADSMDFNEEGPYEDQGNGLEAHE